jgi:hypothetical protein
MARILDVHAGPSLGAPSSTGGVGMSLITFEPDETVSEQLTELVRKFPFLEVPPSSLR